MSKRDRSKITNTVPFSWIPEEFMLSDEYKELCAKNVTNYGTNINNKNNDNVCTDKKITNNTSAH